MSVDVEPNLRPPRLGDTKRFVRVDRVPIIDVHRRRYKKKDDKGNPLKDEHGNDIIIDEEVDEDQLGRICRNSRDREERGEYGLVFLGHTDDDGPETEQPPVVGYMAGYRVGEHNGQPTILADLYIDREDDPSKLLKQYPRRSAEVIGISSDSGFIDSVALIKRAPERELGLVTSYHRKHRKVYRYACPACERKTSMMGTHPPKVKAVKKALQLVEHLLMDAMGHGHDDDDSSGPSGPSEPSDSSGPSEHFDEPSHDSSDISDISDISDVSDSSGDGHLEPSRMRTHRRTSRRSKDPSKSTQVRELVDPSDDVSDSSDVSDTSDTSQPSYSKPMNKRSSPTKMPSEPSNPSEPSHTERLDPGKKLKGRHMSRRHGKKHKDRYAVNASVPSASTVIPEHEGDRSVRGSKNKTIEVPPGDYRKTSRHSSDREVSRMRRDQERIQVSRYQAKINSLEETVGRLQSESEENRKAARLAKIERHVIQLESEGFMLDRSKEVTRLARVRDSDLDGEIENIRTNYRRSPVGQGILPPQMFLDVGGNTLHPPTVDPLAEYNNETRIESPSQSAMAAPGRIFGESVVRFSKTDKTKKVVTVGDKNIVVDDDPSETPFDRAFSAISRYRSSKQKTNK